MPNNLEKKGETYHAILVVPKDVRSILGRAKFKRSTKHKTLKNAQITAAPWVAEWWQEINQARENPDAALERIAKLMALKEDQEAHGEYHHYEYEYVDGKPTGRKHGHTETELAIDYYLDGLDQHTKPSEVEKMKKLYYGLEGVPLGLFIDSWIADNYSNAPHKTIQEARTANQSVQQIQEDLNLSSLPNVDLCQLKARSITRLLTAIGRGGDSVWGLNGMRKKIRAFDQTLISRGYDKRYCEGGSYSYKKTTTHASQARSSDQTSTQQSPKNLQMGEIISSVNINQKVRVGQSRIEAVRSIGSPFEITRFGGVVATSYCQTNAVEDRFITLWFVNGGLAEIESILEHRGVGSCADFILRPSKEDIPQRLRTKSQ